MHSQRWSAVLPPYMTEVTTPSWSGTSSASASRALAAGHCSTMAAVIAASVMTSTVELRVVLGEVGPHPVKEGALPGSSSRCLGGRELAERRVGIRDLAQVELYAGRILQEPAQDRGFLDRSAYCQRAV